MTQHPQASWLRISWWVWFVALDVVFVLATLVSRYSPALVERALVYLDLTKEMNLAAWWSGINLLVLGLLAYELASGYRGLQRVSWWAISLVLLLLSLDEVGSLHERAGGIRQALPAIILAVVILGFGLSGLALHRSTRRAAFLLGGMFFLFGSVIFQERLEHILAWPEWTRGIRSGVEEGTELGGMLLGLYALAQLRQKTVPEGGLRRIIPDPWRMPGLAGLLLAGLGLHLLLSLTLEADYVAGRWGNPAVWYPLALFFLLAAGCLWQRFSRPGPRDPSSLGPILVGRASHGSLTPAPSPWLVIFFLLNSALVIYTLSPRGADSWMNFFSTQVGFLGIYLVQLFLSALIFWRIGVRSVSFGALVMLLAALAPLAGALADQAVFIRFLLAAASPLALLAFLPPARPAVFGSGD